MDGAPMRSEGSTVPATTVSLATASAVVSREGRKNIIYVCTSAPL